jgi:3-oxoacyl-[acyl-carrier-protein] synthase II
MALEDSGLDLKSEDMTRVGTCAGSVLGAMLVSEEQLTALYHEKREKGRVLIPKSTTLGDHISDFLGCRGATITLSNACTTGNHAVGWGFNLLRLGKVDVVIAGGAEAPVLPLIAAGFCSLRVMSRRNDEPERASRPFDQQRDGFVLGEGAAFLILETLKHAKDREARIYAEVVGYSMTGEAYHMVMPAPRVDEIVHTMSLALEDARIQPDEVDYINAHGTSTIVNDIGETLAIKALFGPRAYHIPISATKSMIGHTLGASGAIEIAVCALTVRDGFIHPTINHEVPDPECDLDYVPNEPRQHNVRVAISNSFGFGGNNSTIVVRKW